MLSRVAPETAALGVLFALGASGCETTEATPTITFASPTGLARVGDRLFVANRSLDSLEVVALGASLDQLDMVPGPNKYFPLLIPAGPGPEDLAATADGKLIVILNPVTEELHLVDAETLLQARDAGGGVARLSLGQRGSLPTHLVAAAQACEAPCAGQVYVALSGRGAIVAVEVQRDTNGAASFAPVRVYDVGGAPSKLALHPNGRLLFVTDAAAPELVRVDLLSGATERVCIGGIGEPVAVSTDGSLVLVGRPTSADLVVLHDANGPELAVLDADAAWSPVPLCLEKCAQDPGPACLGAHPADDVLCAGDGGLEAKAGTSYTALFLGLTPAVITPLGAAAAQPGLSVPCESSSRTYAEFALVAGLGGELVYVGLRESADSAAKPTLVSKGWCIEPTLAATKDAFAPGRHEGATLPETPTPLSEYLQDCPTVPSNRARFVCLRDETRTAGVVLLVGSNATSSFTLSWEGALLGLDRDPGAGSVGPDGNFTDLGTDLSDPYSFPIRPRPSGAATGGDILEILTKPALGEPGCAEVVGTAPRQCVFERRIVGVESLDGRGRLLLDSALPAACFPQGGVAYRVRVGDAFVVGSGAGGSRAEQRLAPGEMLGPGQATGRQLPFLFGLRPTDPHPELAACDRYDDAGVPQAPLPPVLSRAKTVGFATTDGFSPFHTGLARDAQGQVSGPVGRVPWTMLPSPVGAFEPAVFISYSASDALLGFVPFDTSRLYDRDVYRVLRTTQ